MKSRALAVGLAVLLTAACGTSAGTPPPTPIRIATISPALGDALARVYNQQVPGIRASVAPADTSRFNLRAIDEGASDIGFVRADIAYAAYTLGTPLQPQPHHRLRGMAVVGRSLLHIVVPGDSAVQSLADLRGAPLGIASSSASARERMAGDGNRGLYRDLLVASGVLSMDDVETVPMAPDALVHALGNGGIAGALSLTPSRAPALDIEAARPAGLRVLAIAPDAAMRIRAQHPFFKPAFIPAGIYDGQGDDVWTIGVDMLLVCREELPEDTVYALVKALFAALPELMRASEIMRSVDPELAPATPIALHPGAARFYREQELPYF